MSKTEDLNKKLDEILPEWELTSQETGSRNDKRACPVAMMSLVYDDDLTDHPECAHSMLCGLVIRTVDGNDLSGDEMRQIVRAGLTGLLDTWWVPVEVVVAAHINTVQGRTPFQTVMDVLGSVTFWKDSKPRVSLYGADLSGADLSGADLSGADLSSANLYGANLRSANLYGADLSSADLSGADLSSANLRSADLSGADLSGADLYGADLRSANLSGADLSSANLYGADLSGADLSGADLSGADLSSANLYGANLRSANLSSADLSSANLYGANLRSANLRSARVGPSTILPAGYTFSPAGLIVKGA